MAKARKEIDKESMYQKIMPSSIRAAAAEPEEKTAAKKPAAPRARKPAVTPRPAPRTPPPPLDTDEDEDEGYDVAQAVQSVRSQAAQATATPASAPPAAASSQAAVINIMERLIDEKIDIAMEKFKCCTCPLCRRDITAYALNKLHPKYIVNDMALLAEAMLDKESNTQVTTALVQAILKIKSNPNHG